MSAPTPARAPSGALVAAAARITGTKKPSPMPRPGRPNATRSAKTPPAVSADAMRRRCGIEIPRHQSGNRGTATFQRADRTDASRPTMDLSGYCLRMPLLTVSLTGDARRRGYARQKLVELIRQLSTRRRGSDLSPGPVSRNEAPEVFTLA